VKVLKKIFTRFNITIVLMAVQAVVYVTLINRFVYFIPIIALIGYVISIIIILRLVIKDEAAAVKIPWILVVSAMPILGTILYFLFGSKHLSRKIKKRLAKENALTVKHLPTNCSLQNSREEGCLKYIRKTSLYPAYANTETKYYPLGVLMFEDMLAEMAKAKKFIFLEYFIIEEGQMWNRLYELLLQKAEEGVEIKLIFDDFVSQRLFTSTFESTLWTKKIKTVRFNPISPLFRPFMNHRDHRKLLLIDGHTGFTGAVNIIDDSIQPSEKFGVWKDTGIRLKGDGVWSFTLMFIEIWNCFCKPNELIQDYTTYNNTEVFATDGLVQPYGDSPFLSERIGENVYIDILNHAKDYVYIFTPFLIISEKMIYALQMAARRGVDVRIVLPGKYDWMRAIAQRVSRSYYKYLLNVGIKIYENPTGYLHAKNFVCDDEIGIVGTINLDYRSLYLHFECAALLYQTSTIQALKQDAIKTMEAGGEVKHDGSGHIGSTFIDVIIHLFAPIM